MTFIPGGGGTVYHLDTGLTWTASVLGLMFDWQDAQDECAALGTGGYDDWRLPTRYELMTIVDYSRYGR
jgi:hypothetical protein